ncbi:MAG: hypothetical protein HUJ42_00940 [Malacoplasma sp.]|nr:hypothetical protein [Malacoplasma sp.]
MSNQNKTITEDKSKWNKLVKLCEILFYIGSAFLIFAVVILIVVAAKGAFAVSPMPSNQLSLCIVVGIFGIAGLGILGAVVMLFLKLRNTKTAVKPVAKTTEVKKDTPAVVTPSVNVNLNVNKVETKKPTTTSATLKPITTSATLKPVTSSTLKPVTRTTTTKTTTTTIKPVVNKNLAASRATVTTTKVTTAPKLGPNQKIVIGKDGVKRVVNTATINTKPIISSRTAPTPVARKTLIKTPDGKLIAVNSTPIKNTTLLTKKTSVTTATAS